MFVIADLEWMTNNEGHLSPTQLAAVRVDENWCAVKEFSARIRPRDPSFYAWKHVSYCGGTPSDFLGAPSAFTVLRAFESWLNEEDVLLWWYEESEELFRKMVGMILKESEPHRAVSIRQYVAAFLPRARGNPYRVAEAEGINTKAALKHCSPNDVRVMRELLEKLGYPQEELLKPLVKKQKTPPLHDDRPYQYEAGSNRIHLRDCDRIAALPTQGFATLLSAIRKDFKPCDCCKEQFRSAVHQRNADILARSQYTYVFTPDSAVYHRPTCGTVLQAKTILGVCHYKRLAQTERVPCRLCKPTPKDPCKPLPLREKLLRTEKKPVQSLTKGEKKALQRQKVAAAERSRRLKEENLTESERNDLYTLTQTGLAFWAGQGYQSFHLRSCPKLQGVCNLKGFAAYREAVGAGYTPCRKCRPTAKQDVEYSIPITDRLRPDERVEDLETLCGEAGYPHHREAEYFCLETAVGKWRINLATAPLRLEHINLVDTPDGTVYHDQPRLFLSFSDAFTYIKRHDEALEKKAVPNVMTLWYNSRRG